MDNKHKGLVLAGIIIVYVGTVILFLSGIQLMIEGLEEAGLLFIIISLGSLTVNILYHTNVIKNNILPGIVGLLTTIIGGIFILIGEQDGEEIKHFNNNTVNNDNSFSNLENKLTQLDVLLSKGIITKEEYQAKRESIINEF